MGWDYCYKSPHQSIADFFREEYKRSGCEVLDCAVVNMRTAYLAVRYPDGYIGAVVCLLDYPQHDPDGMNFGYKAMSEDTAPYARQCPQRILDLLSPVREISEDYPAQLREWALEWRADCRENIRRRNGTPKFQGGEVIKFAKPTTFLDGKTYDTFVIRMRNSRPHLTADEQWYRLPHWQLMNYQVVKGA